MCPVYVGHPYISPGHQSNDVGLQFSHLHNETIANVFNNLISLKVQMEELEEHRIESWRGTCVIIISILLYCNKDLDCLRGGGGGGGGGKVC